MLTNLLIGLLTMALCLFVQLALLSVAIHYYSRHRSSINSSPWSTLVVLNIVMALLVFGNLAQVTVWALLFRMLGEFQELAVAVYHSGVNFSTLGYGDIVMSERWRLLGPLEAANGILMFGVSTAVITAAVSDIMKYYVARQNRDGL